MPDSSRFVAPELLTQEEYVKLAKRKFITGSLLSLTISL